MAPAAGLIAAPALDELAARFAPELRRHLARMLGSADDAEDALQHVWLAVHRNPPGPDVANIRAWLYRVATNAALDRLAVERRRRAKLEARGTVLEPDAPPPADAHGDRMDERTRRLVREHVARLPRKQREAVWLRWVEGLDYDDVARRLDCSAESARANVYQAMKRLREALSPLWEKERAV